MKRFNQVNLLQQKEGERTLLVYAYDKNACQLTPALPETGTGSQALMMVT